MVEPEVAVPTWNGDPGTGAGVPVFGLMAKALMVPLPLLAAYRKLVVPRVAVVMFSAFTSFPPPFPPVRKGEPGISVSAPLLGLTLKTETVLGEKLSLV